MNERLINRTALVYFADINGMTLTVDEVHAYLRARAPSIRREVVERAVNTLTTAGYLERPAELPADVDPMFKVTAAGIRQARRAVKPADLDPLIWEA